MFRSVLAKSQKPHCQKAKREGIGARKSFPTIYIYDLPYEVNYEQSKNRLLLFCFAEKKRKAELCRDRLLHLPNKEEACSSLWSPYIREKGRSVSLRQSDLCFRSSLSGYAKLSVCLRHLPRATAVQERNPCVRNPNPPIVWSRSCSSVCSSLSEHKIESSSNSSGVTSRIIWRLCRPLTVTKSQIEGGCGVQLLSADDVAMLQEVVAAATHQIGKQLLEGGYLRNS
jgi:hypothetical protein